MTKEPDILLVAPGMEHEAGAKAFYQECLKTDGQVDGCGGFGDFVNYADWLAFNAAMKEKAVHPGWARGSTLLAVRRKDGAVVGMLNLRYELTESLLQTGGHIGYGVLPCERRKGYASEMLRQALAICRESKIDPVLITCAEGNAASAGVIEKAGGVYENTVYDEDDDEMVRRYWIHLK